MKVLPLIGLFLFVLLNGLTAQSTFDSLTNKLEDIQQLGYLPGFAVAIVSAEGVHYTHGFGHSDMETQSPFTANSLLNIGSISKTLTGIALMQLVEQGKLSLTTPINDILPLNLHNPYYPEVPITIEHLATHTSSIKDPFDYERTYLFSEKITTPPKELPKEFRKLVNIYNENTPMPIDQFIESMMHPFGDYYKKRNFLKKRPGTTYRYSNMGAAIAGYIIELITGMSYMDYTQKYILEPLAMHNSGWTFDEIDSSRFVSLYLSNNLKIPHYSLISYADGGLITSVHDLSLYFVEMIKGYKGQKSDLLKVESFQKMMNPAFVSENKESGIFWAINGKGKIGHTGGDPGIMTFMMFDPDSGIGRIVFTNKYDEGGNGYNQLVYIWKTLEDAIQKMPVE